MPDQQKSPEQTGLSRRSLVRTAAHAAWAVPAVQVAASVPAYAAASDQLTITSATGEWTPANNRRMDGSITVRNDSPDDTTVNLQVTLTFPNIYVWDANAGGGAGANRTLAITQVTGGWTAGTVTYSGTGTGRTATVVFTATAQIAPTATRTLGFRAQSSGTQANGSPAAINVTASSTGFVSGSGTLVPAP